MSKKEKKNSSSLHSFLPPIPYLFKNPILQFCTVIIIKSHPKRIIYQSLQFSKLYFKTETFACEAE